MGSPGITAPSSVAFPGPSVGRTRTAPRRSAVANSAPETSGTSASAARAPVAHRRGDQPLGRRVRDRRAGRDPVRVRAGGVGEALVRQHPVDDVPPLQDGGRVALAGEDQLLRRAPGRPARPAAAARPSTGSARRRSRPGRTTPSRRPAGCRSDSASSNAAVRREPVRGEDGGHREVLDRLGDPEQLRPELAAAGDRAPAPRRCRGRR